MTIESHVKLKRRAEMGPDGALQLRGERDGRPVVVTISSTVLRRWPVGEQLEALSSLHEKIEAATDRAFSAIGRSEGRVHPNHRRYKPSDQFDEVTLTSNDF